MKAFRGRIICVSMIGSSDILRYPERGTYEGFSRSYHMCLDDRLICPRTHINTQTHTFFFFCRRTMRNFTRPGTRPLGDHPARSRTHERNHTASTSTHAKSPRPHPRRTSTHARTKFDHVCPAPHADTSTGVRQSARTKKVSTTSSQRVTGGVLAVRGRRQLPSSRGQKGAPEAGRGRLNYLLTSSKGTL